MQMMTTQFNEAVMSFGGLEPAPESIMALSHPIPERGVSADFGNITKLASAHEWGKTVALDVLEKSPVFQAALDNESLHAVVAGAPDAIHSFRQVADQAIDEAKGADKTALLKGMDRTEEKPEVKPTPDMVKLPKPTPPGF